MKKASARNLTKRKVVNKAKGVKIVHASRTDIVNMIHGTKGRICTITFTKKDGTARVMNCQRKNGPASELGYILVNDLQKKAPRNVDPREITAFKFQGTEYRPK